jgi:hypothetical protein
MQLVPKSGLSLVLYLGGFMASYRNVVKILLDIGYRIASCNESNRVGRSTVSVYPKKGDNQFSKRRIFFFFYFKTVSKVQSKCTL